MRNFEYFTPTRVIFGKDTHLKIGTVLKEQNCSKVLIHYGSHSAVSSGLIDEIRSSLDEAGISYVTLGGVVPNPRLSKVREGIELCRKEQVDFLLAVGGGSVIDSCKAIGYGLANPDTDVWNFFLRTETPKACLPVGVILTIAASGSEMSGSCVITNEEGWLKRSSARNDLCRPRFAILNPRLTYTLPQYQTESGCVDILMHTMERYFVNIETMEITDSISESLMQTVIYNSRILMKEADNYTHGAGLAALWGSWARYVYDANPERFAQFAVNIFDIPCSTDFNKTALAGIEAMEDYFRSIQMPTSLHELGLDLTEKDIHDLAFKCSYEDTRTIGVFKQLNMKDMEKIYLAAR